MLSKIQRNNIDRGLERRKLKENYERTHLVSRNQKVTLREFEVMLVMGSKAFSPRGNRLSSRRGAAENMSGGGGTSPHSTMT